VAGDLDSNIDVNSPMFRRYGQSDIMNSLIVGCSWETSYCKLLDQLNSGGSLSDITSTAKLMPGSYSPWIYGGDEMLLRLDQAQAKAGFYAGMALRESRASGLGSPDYIVVDGDVIVGPGVGAGFGGLFIFSRSGTVFNAGQANLGTTSYSVSVRAGWLKSGNGRPTEDEVDSFLAGPAVSASVSAFVAGSTVVNFGGTSDEFGLSTQPGLSLALAWAIEAPYVTGGWGV